MTQVVRISVLGGFRIETGGLAKEDRLPRKIAALVGVLAVAGGRGMARERLVGLLWGDGDEEKGRHALAQSVYSLKRTLGIDGVVQGTDRLALNEEVVHTDVGALRVAITAGDAESVLRLGRGTLLDGVNIPGAAAFERWLEEERRDHLRTLVLALDRLAGAATDPQRELDLRRRRADLDPLDATGAMALMRAMAAAGDLPSAIQHARVYGELVRQELELDPDPRIAMLVTELQAAAPVATARAAVQPQLAPEAGGTRIGLRALLRDVGTEVRRRWHRAARRVPWRMVRRASAVAVSSVAVLLALAHYGTEHVVAVQPVGRVAVLPFTAIGTTPELEFLSAGVVDLLGYALAERDTLPMVGATEVTARWPATQATPGADSLRAIARSLGARRLVTGTIVGSAQRLALRAEVLNADAQVQGTVLVNGPLDSLAPMVRRAATQLAAAAAGAQGSVGARELAPRVLRAFLDGLDHYRQGQWEDARRAFGAALANDSTFDVAAVHLALAADWLDDAAAREQALDHVAGRTAELPPTERALAIALRHPRYPAPPTAEDFFGRWEDAARTGDRAVWWVEVGRRYLADGIAAGIGDAGERAARAFARAWAVDSGDPAVMALLAATPDSADGGTTKSGVRARWREALREGNGASVERIRALLDARRDTEPRAVAAAMLTSGVHDAATERVVEQRMAAALGSWGRRDAALSAHARAVDRGDGVRMREAIATIDQLAAFGAGERLAILDVLYGGADSSGIAGVVQRMEARLAMPPVTPDQRRAAVADRCVSEQWRAWQGLRPLPGAAATLAADPYGPGTLAAAVSGPACAALVAAIRERGAPRTPGVALRRAEGLALAGPATGDLRQYATLALAHVRFERGEFDEAWQQIQRRPIGRGWPRYLAAYDHLEGRIAARRDDTTAARAAFQRYLVRRDGSDSTFVRDLAAAREWLDRLGIAP